MNQRGGELESRGYTVSNTIKLCIEAEKQLVLKQQRKMETEMGKNSRVKRFEEQFEEQLNRARQARGRETWSIRESEEDGEREGRKTRTD